MKLCGNVSIAMFPLFSQAFATTSNSFASKRMILGGPAEGTFQVMHKVIRIYIPVIRD